MLRSLYKCGQVYYRDPSPAAALARGVDARDLLAGLANAPGSEAEFFPGRYDFGKDANVLLPPGVKIYCQRYGSVQFVSGFSNNTFPGCCFELQDAVEIEHISLASNCPLNNQSMVVGFGGTDSRPFAGRPGYEWLGAGVDSSKVGCTAILRNLPVYGRGFALYNWSGLGNYLKNYGLDVTCGRWGAYNGASASATACFMDLYGCDFHIIANLCTHQGEQQLNLCCFGARGGRMRTYRCTAELIGNAMTAPAIVPKTGQIFSHSIDGAWVDMQGGIPGTSIELHDFTCRITPDPSRKDDWADVYAGYGNPPDPYGGSGSGTDGKWVKR